MSLNVSLGTLLVLTEVQINDMLETIISYVNDISHCYDTLSPLNHYVYRTKNDGGGTTHSLHTLLIL